MAVRSMDVSTGFHIDELGMQLLSGREINQDNAEIAFLGMEGTDHRSAQIWWRGEQDYAEGDQLDQVVFGGEGCPRWPSA